MAEPLKEEPRDFVITELVWALRHLNNASDVLVDSMSRCRGKPEHTQALCEMERASGFMLSSTFALDRCLEGLQEKDIVDLLATHMEEGK